MAQQSPWGPPSPPACYSSPLHGRGNALSLVIPRDKLKWHALFLTARGREEEGTDNKSQYMDAHGTTEGIPPTSRCMCAVLTLPLESLLQASSAQHFSWPYSKGRGGHSPYSMGISAVGVLLA